MPTPRPSNSSRSGRPASGNTSSTGGARKKTDANERRAPARPRGENPYMRAAKDEAPRGSRSGTPRRTASSRNPAANDGAGNRKEVGAGARRASTSRDSSRFDKPKPPVRKGWGSLARKGAESMREEGPGRESSRQAERIERAPERADTDKWVPEKVATQKAGNTRRSQQRVAEPFVLPKEATNEIEERAGKRGERLVRSLREASKAYAAERWGDVRKSLRPLLIEVGDAPIVMELNGMLLYRTGKWAPALKELEAVHLATQSFDLYPAMMDCQRALKRPKKVAELWEELRMAAPSGEVMAEGRIVMAASLADQDRLQDGIRLLDKTPKTRAEPKQYHLRSWYALADLHERTGDVGKARQLFEKVAARDPELADVLDRIEALG